MPVFLEGESIFVAKLFIIFLFSLLVVSCQGTTYQETGQKRQASNMYSPHYDENCAHDPSLQKSEYWAFVCFTDHGISFLSAQDAEMKPSDQELDQRANDYCTREFNSNARYAGKPNAGIIFSGGREYICG